MERFSEQTPADLARSSRLASPCHRDEDGFPDIQTVQPEKCFYCDRTGGVPFLMIGDELHCSRCFEDFTDEEFAQYLIDSGIPSVHQVGRSTERKVA
jgi:hypothetical protein